MTFVVVVCVSFAAYRRLCWPGPDVASICGTTVAVPRIDQQLRLTKTNFTSNRALFVLFLDTSQILEKSLRVFYFETRAVATFAFLPHYIHLENPGFISSGS